MAHIEVIVTLLDAEQFILNIKPYKTETGALKAVMKALKPAEKKSLVKLSMMYSAPNGAYDADVSTWILKTNGKYFFKNGARI